MLTAACSLALKRPYDGIMFILNIAIYCASVKLQLIPGHRIMGRIKSSTQHLLNLRRAVGVVPAPGLQQEP